MYWVWRFSLYYGNNGRNQFDKPNDQRSFFNCYFFAFYFGSIVSNTAIVYIEDNLSWRLGFGLSAIANFIGLAFLLLGNRFYCHLKPQGSPFTGLVRVITATIRKIKVQLSSKLEDCYCGQYEIAEISTPSKMRFSTQDRRRCSIGWFSSKTVEDMHDATSRRSQEPDENIAIIVDKDLPNCPNSNPVIPVQFDNPLSSSHGPYHWFSFQNPIWVYLGVGPTLRIHLSHHY